MSDIETFNRLLAAQVERTAKVELLVTFGDTMQHLEIRMLQNANIIETERHVRFAQRMDQAAKEVFWTSVLAIVTLGWAAAVEGLMAAGWATTGTNATSAGVRLAASAQKVNNSAGLVNKVRTLVSSSEVLGSYAEYYGCKFMLQAPGLMIRWAIAETGDVKMPVPGSIRTAGGPLKSDKPGVFHWLMMLRTGYAVYKKWNRGQIDERKYYEDMINRCRRIYLKVIDERMARLPAQTRNFIGLSGIEFGQIDDRIDVQLDGAIRENIPDADTSEARQVKAGILRSIWTQQYQKVQPMLVPLQVEIRKLDNEIIQLKERLDSSGPVTVEQRVLDYQMRPF